MTALAQVYIIGVGPGDPDLLTIKGHKILAQADVVVYADSLIPAPMLCDLQPEAEVIATSSLTLEEIVPLMIDRVRSKKLVVRLHSGDLTLYSAITEQIQGLRAAQITCELIPGISTYQAAAARLQVELTVPELVQTIILTRSQGRASAMPSPENLASLAAHQSSLCLYLAAKQVQKAQAQLLAHYPADTPVAICWRVSWPDEKIWVVPLADMAAATEREQLLRTTMYIISPALGAVAGYRSQLYNPTYTHLFRSKLD
jgi:precorrin-4/cobalt-precorrin-4 C11-methyltransferase